MSEKPYPEGVDRSWLASDREGHLGVFVTGGCGPIPVLALLRDYPLDAMEEQLLKLPTTSDAHLPVRMPESSVFVQLAERGLFVYDWSDVHRTKAEQIGEYELTALPYRPLTLDLLSDDLADAARSVRFNVAFQTAWLVNVRAHLPCREAPA
jgi:hypothetical protein